MKLTEKPRVVLSWSTGKDAAWTLHMMRQAGDVEIVGLLTTVNAEFGRVAMHATRRDLLELQAAAVGLPLVIVPIPWPCTNAQYEAAFAAALAEVRAGFQADHIAFGDLFLEDVRAYREKQLQGTGLTPLFPLWGRPTGPLAEQMIDAGLRAVVTCVNPNRLPDSFAGRAFDRSLLEDLPHGVDWCGEAGEFHTCVLDGPMFEYPLNALIGEIVARDGFVFADVVPVS